MRQYRIGVGGPDLPAHVYVDVVARKTGSSDPYALLIPSTPRYAPHGQARLQHGGQGFSCDTHRLRTIKTDWADVTRIQFIGTHHFQLSRYQRGFVIGHLHLEDMRRIEQRVGMFLQRKTAVPLALYRHALPRKRPCRNAGCGSTRGWSHLATNKLASYQIKPSRSDMDIIGILLIESVTKCRFYLFTQFYEENRG